MTPAFRFRFIYSSFHHFLVDFLFYWTNVMMMILLHSSSSSSQRNNYYVFVCFIFVERFISIHKLCINIVGLLNATLILLRHKRRHTLTHTQCPNTHSLRHCHCLGCCCCHWCCYIFKMKSVSHRATKVVTTDYTCSIRVRCLLLRSRVRSMAEVRHVSLVNFHLIKIQ